MKMSVMEQQSYIGCCINFEKGGLSQTLLSQKQTLTCMIAGLKGDQIIMNKKSTNIIGKNTYPNRAFYHRLYCL